MDSCQGAGDEDRAPRPPEHPAAVEARDSLIPRITRQNL